MDTRLLDSAPAAPPGSLLLVPESGGERRLSTRGPHMVGRGDGCAVRLDDPAVSVLHASITRDGPGWMLRDEASSNGTYVNDAPIAGEYALRDGDVVTCGNTRMAVHIADPPAAAPRGPAGTVLLGAEPTERPVPRPAPGRPVTIGRAADNAVVLDDRTVSRHHAVLELVPDGVVVSDLDSQNGTYLNGVAVRSDLVRPGDRLRIGKTVFALDRAGGPLSAARPVPALEAHGLGLRGRNDVVLLRDVSVSIAPGELVAILGPAGAGKSTLLNVLSGVATPAAGQVRVGGEPLSAMYADIARVPQEDIVHRDLTPREALRFAAGLRLPPDHTRAEVETEVARLLAALDLEVCADRSITVISGGQRKRVSVAMELVGEPRLVFLDEPAAGLDAAHDRDLMNLCRRLADAGQAVVLTTHNTWHVNVCDRLLLVGRGGVLRYDGPPDRVLATFGAPSLTEVYDALDQPDPHPPAPAQVPAAAPGADGGTGAPPRRLHVSHVRTLIRRNLVLMLRDPKSMGISLVGAPAMAALAVLLFGGDALSGRPGTSPDSVNLLLALTLVATWLGAFAGLRAIVAEAHAWRREYSLGVAPSSYLVAKLVVQGGLVLLQGVLIGAVFVLLADTALTHGTLAAMCGLIVLTGVAGVTAGLLISAVARNEARAVSLVLPYVVLQFFFAGVVVAIEEMGGLGVVAWITSARWSVAGLGALAGVSDRPQSGPLFLDKYGTEFFTSPAALYVGALVALTAVAVILTRVALGRGARATG